MNGQASSPVLTSGFLYVPDHSAIVLCSSIPASHCWAKVVFGKEITAVILKRMAKAKQEAIQPFHSGLKLHEIDAFIGIMEKNRLSKEL